LLIYHWKKCTLLTKPAAVNQSFSIFLPLAYDNWRNSAEFTEKLSFARVQNKYMKKIISVIGARPQFIKHAPLQLQLQKYFHSLTLHTGQHYDSKMSNVFFDELNIPAPDFLLDIAGNKLQGAQTAVMLTEIEKILIAENPAAVIVYGDTNSTLAATLAAVKMHIPVVHVEAGLRSYNRHMPEEINRIISDEFAELLFCPTTAAIENLKKEGIVHDGIILCGDVMYDMIKLIEPKTKRLFDEPYFFATIHRPYNTDDAGRLLEILNTLNQLSQKVVFPIHPRTLARLESYGMNKADFSNINFIEPVGYIESVSYQKYSTCIITDSGGMQKEAYMLQKKCITVRSETEWGETLQNGWNKLVFDNIKDILQCIDEKPGEYIAGIYGDGNAAADIAETIFRKLN